MTKEPLFQSSEMHPIPFERFNCHALTLWSRDHLLLTTGDFSAGQFNTMTVGWGTFGTMWAKPVAMIVVRPQRFTMEFLREGNSFTLAALPEDLHNALELCGSRSGRDTDKFHACNLTAAAAKTVEAPMVGEAELSIECKVLYHDVFRGKNFRAKKIVETVYAKDDFHEIFYGEILHIEGTDKYRN